jgi:hypothetical protein
MVARLSPVRDLSPQQLAHAKGNSGPRPRLWENVWDEAADALCFPARQLGCRIDRLTRCGLNEAIRS